MNQAPDVIGEYAHLLNQLESMAAAGQQPPPQMVERALAIETQASAMLNPEQLDAAMGHVTQLRQMNKAHDSQVAATRQHVGQTVEMAHQLRQHTENMGPDNTPLENLDEFQAVMQGEKFTRPNRTKQKAQKRHTNAAAYAKRYGFKSPEKMIEHMDTIVHRYADHPEVAMERLEKLGMTEEDLHAYQRNRVDIIMTNHLSRKAATEGPDEIEHTPDDRDQVRTKILKAAADNGADELLEKHDVPEDWKDPDRGDGLTADIYNAIKLHEDTDTAVELQEKENEILADTGSY